LSVTRSNSVLDRQKGVICCHNLTPPAAETPESYGRTSLQLPTTPHRRTAHSRPVQTAGPDRVIAVFQPFCSADRTLLPPAGNLHRADVLLIHSALAVQRSQTSCAALYSDVKLSNTRKTLVRKTIFTVSLKD
jgi:hypothetical protein